MICMMFQLLGLYKLTEKDIILMDELQLTYTEFYDFILKQEYLYGLYYEKLVLHFNESEINL